MRVYNRIGVFALLGILGCALLLPGCTKENDKQSDSDNLQFSATYLETKAVYGDDAGSYQRIIWLGGDDVRIASDRCQTALGSHSSDYSVAPLSGASNAYRGTISHIPTYQGQTEDSGLRWADGASGRANFWSTYPASAMEAGGSDRISTSISSSTSLAIAAVKQPSGSVVKILDPVNGSYPMVSYVSGVSAGTSLVNLIYYPAFTAFQVTLTNDTGADMTLASCAISSTTSVLCGRFSASISDLAKDSPVTSSVSVTSGAGYKVSAGVNQVLTDGQSVTFSIFCLPTDITNATFECTYTDANGTKTKTLALNRNDQPIVFAACKQHRINLRFDGGGNVDYEITPVIALIVSSAFPDDYTYSNGEVVDKDGNPVSLEELQEAILSVRHVTITDSHGIDTVNYVNGMYAFTNLETLTIDGANSVQSVTVEGLPHFKLLDIKWAPAIHEVTVSDCPWTENVRVNTNSLETVTLNNLTNLKTITIDEGGANSNLKTFTLTNCPDLEEAYFGQTGALKTLDMSGSTKLKTLEIGLAYQLQNLDLTDCTSLETLSINEANSMTSLDIEECTSLKSLILYNPQSLLVFQTASRTLETLKFIGDRGAQSLITMSLDTPSLTTIEMTNNQSLVNLTLSNLPSAINNFVNIVPSVGGNGSRNLTNLSMTNCSGFTNLSINPADHVTSMAFDSCSGLQSVTLHGNNSTNVWAWPEPTTNITATKRNCPSLSDTYTVDCWGTVGVFPFTVL